MSRKGSKPARHPPSSTIDVLVRHQQTGPESTAFRHNDHVGQPWFLLCFYGRWFTNPPNYRYTRICLCKIIC